MAQKKVCILSLGRRGGSVRYATAIIDQMTELPKDVFVSRFCSEPMPENARKVITYRNGLEFILSTLFRMPFLLVYIFFQLVKGKYQALYLPYPHMWNPVFIATFRRFNVKTIATIHDGIPHLGEGNLFEKWVGKYSVKKADTLIFLTKFVQHLAAEKIGYEAPSFVIPHGLIHPKGIIQQRRKLSKNPKILFFGRVGQYKGVDLLLEAIQDVDTSLFDELIIAGTHLPSVSFQKSPHKVRWIKKWLSEKEMVDLMNTSDILVLPYREASQSGVITIGIFAALPIVCTNAGGIPEQLSPQEALFVEPEPVSIKEGIEKLLTDPVLYDKLVDQLIQKRKKSDWKEIALEIQKLLNDHPGG